MPKPPNSTPKRSKPAAPAAPPATPAAAPATKGLQQYEAVIKRARLDPVWFAREILQLKALPGEPTLSEDPDGSWELDAWQVEMLEAAGDVVRRVYGQPTRVNHNGVPLISIRACQGPGKTFGAALTLHWFQFCFPALAVCTAPKLGQVTSRLWREFIKIQGRAIPGYSDLMVVGGESIAWNTAEPSFMRRWVAVAETGSTPESLQGFHEKYLLAIIDEASGVRDDMFEVIRGAMSTGRVLLCLMIGNPNKTNGFFADSHRRADLAKDYYRMSVSCFTSARVKQSWVDQLERQYGKSSPVVKIRCYGEFAETSELQLIAPEWVVAATERDFPAEGDGSMPRMRISVDVADGGEDETVFTIARHWDSTIEVLKQVRRSYETAVAVPQAFDEACRLWQEWGFSTHRGDDIVVDAMGVGSGLAGMLIRADYPTVVYKGGEASAAPTLYRNRRVQSYIALRNAFRDGGIVIRDGAVDGMVEFEAQVCGIQLRPGAESRVEDLITKADMKRDGIKSPDMADSLAMQFATKTPTIRDGNAVPKMEDIIVQESSVLRGYTDV